VATPVAGNLQRRELEFSSQPRRVSRALEGAAPGQLDGRACPHERLHHRELVGIHRAVNGGATIGLPGVDSGSALEEKADELQVSGGSRRVQRCRLVVAGGVRVDTSIEEEANDRKMALTRGELDRRGRSPRVGDRTGGEKPADRRPVADVRGDVERRPTTILDVVRVRAMGEESLQCLGAARIAGREQRRAPIAPLEATRCRLEFEVPSK